MKLKRWLAMLLCIAQILALLAVPVFATGPQLYAELPTAATLFPLTEGPTMVDSNAPWYNDSLYVSFTPTTAGEYKVSVSSGDGTGGEVVQICADNDDAVCGAGCDFTSLPWNTYIVCELVAGTEYVFCVPRNGASCLTVCVEANQSGGSGSGPMGPTAATMPSGVTPVTVTGDAAKLDDWQANGYAYVQFTATQDGTYTIFAKGTSEGNEDIQICEDASPQTGSGVGSGEENGTLWYHRFLTFEANQNETYVFQIPQFGSSDVYVYVGEGFPNDGGPGGGSSGSQFTPIADNVYVGNESPDGIQYAEGIAISGAFDNLCYLGYYDGTEYKTLSGDDVSVTYEYQDGTGYTTDDGSVMTITKLDGNDLWCFTPNCATIGQLAVNYNQKTYYIPVQIFGIQEPTSSDPVTVVPADGTEITLDDATWINGMYVYLSFTPTEDGTYAICADAARKDTGPINSAIELCGDDFSVLNFSEAWADDENWQAYGYCTMKANTTYYFMVIAEPDRLNSITVSGKPYEEDAGDPGPMPAYPVPELEWPKAGTAEAEKILNVTIDDDPVKVNSNLVELTADWYGVNFTVTPTTSGVYKLALEIPDGYVSVDPTGELMFQSIRSEEIIDFVSGGFEIAMGSTDIHMWDQLNLEAGKTYHFQYLVCRHGVDDSKDVELQITSVSLKTDNITVDPNGNVYAVVSGTYDQDNEDETVTTENNEVTIDATSDETSVTDVSVSIGGSSVESLVDNQVSSVTIRTDVADVTFDSTALDTINATEKNVTLSVAVEETESGVLNVELTLVDSDGNPVLPDTTAATNGTVTVTIPYEVPAGKSIQVYYVDDAGNKTLMNAQYDEETGLVTFETSHFSTYEIHPVADPCNGNHTFTKYTETKAATCTEKGSETAICDKCKTVTDTREIAAKGHSYEKSVCTRCGSLKTGCTCDEDCPVHDYTDVEAQEWYHRDGYIDYVVSNGIMIGTTKDTFEPESEMTRAHMVRALWNLAGQPASDYKLSYTDVKESDWFYPALAWATEKGLAKGMPDGSFEPDEALTRDQMVTFLYRYATIVDGMDVTASEIPDTFSDRDEIMPFAKDAFAWAIDRGIINGMKTTPETLAPFEAAERAQLAKILTVYDLMK